MRNWMPPCGTACFVENTFTARRKTVCTSSKNAKRDLIGTSTASHAVWSNPILPDCAYGKVVQRSQEVNNAVFVCICIFALKPNNNIEINHLYFALIFSLSLLSTDNFIWSSQCNLSNGSDWTLKTWAMALAVGNFESLWSYLMLPWSTGMSNSIWLIR